MMMENELFKQLFKDNKSKRLSLINNLFGSDANYKKLYNLKKFKYLSLKKKLNQNDCTD